MLVLIVLAAGVLISRTLGFVGVEAFDSWPAATRAGLALMFLFTASAHFTSMRHDLARMFPPGCRSLEPWCFSLASARSSGPSGCSCQRLERPRPWG